MKNTVVKQMTVEIIMANFDRNESLWFLYGDDLYFHADIVDDDFWDKLKRHEIKIGHGDKMTVELTIEQEIFDDFVMTEHTSVMRVIEYLPGKSI